MFAVCSITMLVSPLLPAEQAPKPQGLDTLLQEGVKTLETLHANPAAILPPEEHAKSRAKTQKNLAARKNRTPQTLYTTGGRGLTKAITGFPGVPIPTVPRTTVQLADGTLHALAMGDSICSIQEAEDDLLAQLDGHHKAMQKIAHNEVWYTTPDHPKPRLLTRAILEHHLHTGTALQLFEYGIERIVPEDDSDDDEFDDKPPLPTLTPRFTAPETTNTPVAQAIQLHAPTLYTPPVPAKPAPNGIVDKVQDKAIQGIYWLAEKTKHQGVGGLALARLAPDYALEKSFSHDFDNYTPATTTVHPGQKRVLQPLPQHESEGLLQLFFTQAREGDIPHEENNLDAQKERMHRLGHDCALKEAAVALRNLKAENNPHATFTLKALEDILSSPHKPESITKLTFDIGQAYYIANRKLQIHARDLLPLLAASRILGKINLTTLMRNGLTEEEYLTLEKVLNTADDISKIFNAMLADLKEALRPEEVAALSNGITTIQSLARQKDTLLPILKEGPPAFTSNMSILTPIFMAEIPAITQCMGTFDAIKKDFESIAKKGETLHETTNKAAADLITKTYPAHLLPEPDAIETLQPAGEVPDTVTIAPRFQFDWRKIGIKAGKMIAMSQIATLFIKQRAAFIADKLITYAETFDALLTSDNNQKVAARKKNIMTALKAHCVYVPFSIKQTASIKHVILYFLVFELLSYFESCIKTPSLVGHLCDTVTNSLSINLLEANAAIKEGKNPGAGFSKSFIQSLRTVTQEFMIERQQFPIALPLTWLGELFVMPANWSNVQEWVFELFISPKLWNTPIASHPAAAMITSSLLDDAKMINLLQKQSPMKALLGTVAPSVRKTGQLVPDFYSSPWFIGLKKFLIAFLTMRFFDQSLLGKLHTYMYRHQPAFKVLLQKIIAYKNRKLPTTALRTELIQLITQASRKEYSFALLKPLKKIVGYAQLRDLMLDGTQLMLSMRGKALGMVTLMLLALPLLNATGIPVFLKNLPLLFKRNTEQPTQPIG